MESKTPRTDAVAVAVAVVVQRRHSGLGGTGDLPRPYCRNELMVPIDLAQRLETELAEARAEIERLKAEIRDNNHLAVRQIIPAEMAVDDLRAEIERKDKLIEQMREALKLALTEARSTHCENTIKAALESAKGATNAPRTTTP